MNGSKIGLASALWLASAVTAGADDRMDYKCHVQTADGGEHIIYISTKHSEQVHEVAAEKQVLVGRGSRQPVTNVIECRRKAEPFSQLSARMLEDETPN